VVMWDQRAVVRVVINTPVISGRTEPIIDM